MDKKSILALLLISVIVIVWLVIQSSNVPPPKPPANAEKSQQSSTFTQEPKAEEKNIPLTEQELAVKDSSDKMNKYGADFISFASGDDEIITIETDLVIAKFSKKGAVIKEWQLKKFKTWNGYPSQLVQDPKGELYLSLLAKDGKRIDSRDLFFAINNSGKTNYKLNGKDSLVLTATLGFGDNKSIVKTFTFYGDQYILKTDLALNNVENYVHTRGYNYIWSDGIKYQENNSVDESGDAEAMISLNGDIEDLNADGDQAVEKNATGIIDFVGVKSKYFGAAIIPATPKSFDGTADIGGFNKKLRNEGVVEKYTMSLRIPYNGGATSQSFNVYIGPLDYNIVKQYGLTDMVSFGWRFLVRPIGEYFMLPIFNMIHKFIANYGIAIIFFSIIMKLLLYPFSIGQMRSAQKMQLLAPEMEKLREKHKDDQAAQQQATMKLYSEYGINPAGGCLPLLLQMPILYALWSVLRSAIDLRQSSFFWWITDLSQPDVIVSFGASFLGIKAISGLALLMGVTMFIQQKMTVTDPRQKAMVWMMPIMFTLMFSSFPAGLNLYYFMFNLMSIIQQYYINNLSKNKLTLEDLRRAPKKEGWMQKKMREAQELAASQGKTIPGQNKPGNLPKKKK
jgi:YidC/Oxa1 family membrane protein insertase